MVLPGARGQQRWLCISGWRDTGDPGTTGGWLVVTRGLHQLLLPAARRFEASGMTIAPGPDNQDWLWVVFDNLHALGECFRGRGS